VDISRPGRDECAARRVYRRGRRRDEMIIRRLVRDIVLNNRDGLLLVRVVVEEGGARL
jgi:hypothetical protein